MYGHMMTIIWPYYSHAWPYMRQARPPLPPMVSPPVGWGGGSGGSFCTDNFRKGKPKSSVYIYSYSEDISKLRFESRRRQKHSRTSKENSTLLEAGSKRDQLRFDCAGASGSRVGSFRKTNKSEENKTCEARKP